MKLAHLTPHLIPLDMSKAYEHEHPDIKVDHNVQYLCYIDGNYWVGFFSRQWYGLTLNVIWGQGQQFDAPGYNSSGWVQIWEIVDILPTKEMDDGQ